MLAILFVVVGALGLKTYRISFGRYYITAAHITGNIDPAVVATVAGNDEYRAYQADVLHNLQNGIYTHNDSKAQKVFVQAILEVKVAAAAALDRDVDILAMALPQHFNSSSRLCAIKAAHFTEPRFVLGNQMRYFLNSAMAAYRLNTCEGLGYVQRNCNLDDVHMGIFLNYDTEQIEMYITDLSEYGVFVSGHLKLDLKGNYLSKNSSTPIGTPEPNYGKIQTAFENFLTSHFTPESQDLIEDIYGIVISGETSPEGILTISLHKLHQMMARLFPNKVDKIKDSIDPQFVGAVGAAFWARRFTEEPSLLIEECNGYYPGVGHDEL